MSRIAVPMVGGMVTAPLLSLFVIPAAYWLMRHRKCHLTPRIGPEDGGFSSRIGPH
ncbi:Cation efflux system protein CusA [compost metagenome]